MRHTRCMYKKSAIHNSHGVGFPLLRMTLDVRYYSPNPTTGYMCLCTPAR